MKIRVGISLRIAYQADYDELRDAISHDWIEYLEGFDVLPVLIPNALNDPVNFVKQIGAQALLLTGGGNVFSADDSSFDIQKNRFERIRDNTERLILDWAKDSNIPVLGVCRGMQALNIYFKGSLLTNLTMLCGSGEAHINTIHEIQIENDDFCRQIGVSSVYTNSFHRHAVTKETLSRELCPFAFSSEGIVEGFYHPRLPIVGIQWHPERPNSATDVDYCLVNRWLRKG